MKYFFFFKYASSPLPQSNTFSNIASKGERVRVLERISQFSSIFTSLLLDVFTRKFSYRKKKIELFCFVLTCSQRERRQGVFEYFFFMCHFYIVVIKKLLKCLNVKYTIFFIRNKPSKFIILQLIGTKIVPDLVFLDIFL